MYTMDLSKSVIVKRAKLWNTEEDNFRWNQKKVVNMEVNSLEDQRNYTFFEEF